MNNVLIYRTTEKTNVEAHLKSAVASAQFLIEALGLEEVKILPQFGLNKPVYEHHKRADFLQRQTIQA